MKKINYLIVGMVLISLILVNISHACCTVTVGSRTFDYNSQTDTWSDGTTSYNTDAFKQYIKDNVKQTGSAFDATPESLINDVNVAISNKVTTAPDSEFPTSDNQGVDNQGNTPPENKVIPSVSETGNLLPLSPEEIGKIDAEKLSPLYQEDQKNALNLLRESNLAGEVTDYDVMETVSDHYTSGKTGSFSVTFRVGKDTVEVKTTNEPNGAQGRSMNEISINGRTTRVQDIDDEGTVTATRDYSYDRNTLTKITETTNSGSTVYLPLKDNTFTLETDQTKTTGIRTYSLTNGELLPTGSITYQNNKQFYEIYNIAGDLVGFSNPYTANSYYRAQLDIINTADNRQAELEKKQKDTTQKLSEAEKTELDKLKAEEAKRKADKEKYEKDRKKADEDAQKNEQTTFNIASVAGFFHDLTQTRLAIAANAYWLDKMGWFPTWSRGMSDFFGEWVTGIKAPTITGICEQWVRKDGTPSSVAMGRGGTVGAHIEGDRYESATYTGSAIAKTWIYKITLGVSPSNIVRDTAEYVKFSVYLEPGHQIVYMNKNDPNTAVIVLKRNSGEYRIDGSSNPIVRELPNAYDQVCIDLLDSDLDSVFRYNLGGTKLCNSLTQTVEPALSQNEIGIGRAITTASWGSTGGGSNDNNKNGRDPNENAPGVVN